MDCGQSNPISQLVRHVTEDQRFQESIGDPRSSIVGSNQSDLTLPQSFRMDELMREMRHIEPQSMLMPSSSSSSSDFTVQNHTSLGTMWMPEYQNQMQDIFQPKIEHNMWNVPNAQNYFPAEGFINQHRPNEIHVLTQFESKSRECRQSLKDLDGAITINSIDELEKLNQPEETTTCPKEIQDEQLPNQNYNDEKTSIPFYSNARQFCGIVDKFVKDCRKKDWNLKHPNQKMNIITSRSLLILNPVVYSHIENNPMKEELEPFKKGTKALDNACYLEAELCFDEAIRRNETEPENWIALSCALYNSEKCDKAMSVINHYLRLKPSSFDGAYVKFLIYRDYDFKYQACQAVFNWLQNNESYKHLIPPDFSMSDKNTFELDDKLLNSVKNIFLKAARENPINIDADLQIMIGSLYYLSQDFDKVIDCKLAAINSLKNPARELIGLGYMLFYDEKPYEAFASFFEAAEDPGYKTMAYTAIGFVFMYLKNYREAIGYFTKLLYSESLHEDAKFQLKGNTLEDEYDLCLRLFSAISNR